jgi:hypothetical protein
MSKFKKIYHEWFGLRENDLSQSIKDADNEINPLTDKLKQVTNAAQEAGLLEIDLDEAQLVNNITDYQGHVMYRLRDPQEAKMVAKDIMQWTKKKGFTIIKHDRSRTGLTGYFYFRIGEDLGTESQKIQGYFSQMPEIEKFIFRAPRNQ